MPINQPLTGRTPSYILRTNGGTKGSTNTNVVIYGTAVESSGSDITYTNSATNGDGFLVNVSGVYSVSLIGRQSVDATYQIRIGAIDNLANDAKTRSSYVILAGVGAITWTGYVPSGSYVFIFNNNTIDNSIPVLNQITVTGPLSRI